MIPPSKQAPWRGREEERAMSVTGSFEVGFAGSQAGQRVRLRDVYESGRQLLIVASDRMSAFDVVMDRPHPDKGKNPDPHFSFWFKRLEGC